MIDPGKWETVLRAGSVGACEVYTHAPFSIGLLDDDDVGQPLGIIDFPDESSSQKLFYFFHNSLVPFRGKNSSFLLDGLFGGVDIQLVFYHLIVYPRNIYMSPSEDVQILLEELHNPAF